MYYDLLKYWEEIGEFFWKWGDLNLEDDVIVIKSTAIGKFCSVSAAGVVKNWTWNELRLEIFYCCCIRDFWSWHRLWLEMEWLKLWTLGIQASAKVTWFGELPDGKSILS